MGEERLFSFRNRWFAVSVGAITALFLVAATSGLVALPYAQPGLRLAGVWDAICSAAGVPSIRSETQTVQPDFKTSQVILTSSMLRNSSPASIGHGATLALKCAICHGPSGISQAEFPNLAGQYASVVYKELQDFKSGARTNAVMSPFAASMDEQAMVDVAAYYAFLPRLPAYHPGGEQPAPRIVINGAPLRGIAPCGSCHGGLDAKVGSPWLEGQPGAYIQAQLENFAHSTRRNDINQQMRNVARNMTPEEIQAAARYYASQPAL